MTFLYKYPLLIGFLLSLLTPFSILFLINLFFLKGLPFGMFLQSSLIAPLIALSSFFNLIWFYVGIKKNDKLSQGILSGTFVLFFLMLCFKFG